MKIFRDINTLLPKGINHRISLERRSKVELDGGFVLTIGVEKNFVVTSDLLHHSRQKLLSHSHEVVVIRISHVKLTGSKLGVVGLIHLLVSKLATNFIDAIKTSNNQLFKIQFRGNTKEEIETQVIVLGDERFGSGTTSLLVHHRGLNLHKSSVVQIFANVSDGLGTDLEDSSDFVLVHNQIEVSHAEPGFCVLKTFFLGGEKVEARGKESDFLGDNTELSRFGGFSGLVFWAGAEGVSLNTNNVTTSEEFVHELKLLLGLVGFFVAEDLDLDVVLDKIVEAEVGTRSGFTVQATIHLHEILISLQLLTFGQFLKLLTEFLEGMSSVVFVGVWLNPFRAESLDHLETVGVVLSRVKRISHQFSFLFGSRLSRILGFASRFLLGLGFGLALQFR
mmetsp:Transcript_11228/g.16992  ORF Transcript_11228/g.16992 Transcript_11228/m.16992 type:complete len:393 (+) Transcript_11228:553-1731(+)